MASEHVNAAIRELADGVAYWRSHGWPADLNNAEYDEWARNNPNGNFTLDWWQQYQLPRLREWRATRPYSGAVLTPRYTECVTALEAAWQAACAPNLERDITSVTWEEVMAFPNKVAKIKPTNAPSPTFTSKFCHFLLPKVFPVVDNDAVAGGWGLGNYQTYFKFVQYEWSSTDASTRADLITALTEATGSTQLYSGYPIVNKIVELRLIGRSHPR
jgi:hypothetical protein